MKTLVIHPFDSTTQFLCEVYKDFDFTVVTTNDSKSSLKKKIKEHDRIIMLGHGSDKGLFGFKRIVIDSSLVYLLRDKLCIGIWCNADLFFNKYGLKGYFSGMIISDESEAEMFCLHPFTLSQIEASNKLFAASLKESIYTNDFVSKMNEKYQIEDNPIVGYNKERIFMTEPTKLNREVKYVFSHNFEHVDENLNIILPDDYVQSMDDVFENMFNITQDRFLEYHLNNPNVEIPTDRYELLKTYTQLNNLSNESIRIDNIYLRHKEYRRTINSLTLTSSNCLNKTAIKKLKQAYYELDIVATDEDCLFDLQKRKNELLLLEILQ